MSRDEKINRRFRISEKVGKWLLLTFTIYTLFPQFIINVRYSSTGGSFIFVSYYWLIHLGLLTITAVLMAKYTHPLGIFARIPFIAFMSYFSMRYLVDQILILAPFTWFLNFMIFVSLAYNLLFSIFQLARIHQKEGILSKLKKVPKSRTVQVLLIIMLIYLPITTWSYYGFGMTVDLTNENENSDIKMSIYGWPWGSLNDSYYSTPEWDKEAQYYVDMNTTFYMPWGRQYMIPSHPSYLQPNATVVFQALEDKGIPFSFCLGPWNPNSPDNRSDFFTYYYLEEMNTSIQSVMEYIEDEGFSNFAGIQIDPEGPKYAVDSAGIPQVISREQYAAAVEYYDELFSDLKNEYPDNITSTISVMTAFFDYLDTDNDLDIALKSISGPPLEFDYYGWQAYMIDTPYGEYRYLHVLEVGMEQYGAQFVPWVGWINNYEQMDGSEYYDSFSIQVEMCKMIGATEMVLAPSRYFFGSSYNSAEAGDYDKVISRLKDLNTTRNTTSSTLSFNVHQNMRFFDDFSFWLEKIVPSYWYVHYDMWKDVMFSADTGFMLILNIFLLASTSAGFFGKDMWSKARKQLRKEV